MTLIHFTQSLEKETYIREKQNTMKQGVQLHELYFEPYIEHQYLQARIAELRTCLERDYQNRQPLFISVLNGAFLFTADLLKGIQLDCDLCFVKVASYVGTTSSGHVQELIGLDLSLQGRDVVLLEDIVDSGRTLEHLLPGIKAQEPASVRVACLLLKPHKLTLAPRPDYVCFETDDRFLVGYGLDYNQRGRQLKDIYVLP